MHHIFVAIDKCDYTLISKSTEINVLNDLGDTPLHYAIEYSSLDIITLLVKLGAGIDRQSNIGETPLHSAIRSANPKYNIIEYLLKKEAHPNLADYDNYTPLHTAVFFGYKDIVTLLLDYGANSSLKNNNNESPKELAHRLGYHKMVQLMDSYDDVPTKNAENI